MKTHVKSFFLPYLILGLLSMMACNKDESAEEPTKIKTEKIIGTWQIMDGDYNGTITFEEGSLLAYDYFTHNLHAGISMHEWSLVGNQLSMSLFTAGGDYSDYNEMPIGTVRNYVVEITDNELTINYKGVPYVYTRLASDSIISETEIDGSWQSTEGSSDRIISFNTGNIRNIGVESYMSVEDSGAVNFLWDINGNMINISNSHYYGDYKIKKLAVSKVSIADNKLTFLLNGESNTYTRVSEDNILSKNDLLGSWKLTEGTQNEILSFDLLNYSNAGSSTHSFIDGTLSGLSVSNFWTVSGDIFSIKYQGGFYDDYSSNFGINAGESISTRISSSNNQITFYTSEGDYTYTRMDDNEIVTNLEIEGTWEITNGNYIGELTFNNNGTGLDSFTDDTQSGTAGFRCVFNGNMLRLSYNSMTGDYESYNETSIGESTYSLLSLTGNQLTITNDGVDFIYTKKTN